MLLVITRYRILSKHHFTTFKEVTEDDVRQAIMKFATKSCTLDTILTHVLKEHVSSLVPIITKMVNISMSSGTVPPSFKMALVTPSLIKATLDPNTLKNYIPVSNLPYLSISHSFNLSYTSSIIHTHTYSVYNYCIFFIIMLVPNSSESN